MNLQQIENANKRVAKALNRRYERNSELFISKQDVEDIRLWLYEGQFSYVYSKFQSGDIHPDIYFLTVLKNSWLINEITEKSFHDFLLPIIKKVRPQYAKECLVEVADRKFDVPDLLRSELLKYYAALLPIEEIEGMLKKKEILGVLRIRLFVARLLEQYVGTPQFIKQLEYYAEIYPEIKGEVNFLYRVSIKEDLMHKQMKVIGEYLNMQCTKQIVSKYIVNGLYFNYEILYEYAIEQAKQMMNEHEARKLWFKQIAVAAHRLMNSKSAESTRKQISIELLQLYKYFIEHHTEVSNYYIRYCLKRIENDYFCEQLKLFFKEERKEKIDDYFKQDLEEAINGRDFSPKTIEELIKNVKQHATDVRYLPYAAAQFKKLGIKKSYWIRLFKELDYTSKCMTWFVPNILKMNDKNEHVWRTYFQAVEESNIYEQYALQVILQYAPQNNVAKRYLEKQDYATYSQLYRL